MSQQNYPLYGSTDLDPVRSCFEVYFAEGGFESRSYPPQEEPQVWRFITAYVNLCPRSHGPANRRNLFATMNHVREQFISLPVESAGPALSALLEGLQESILSVVVVLPDHNDSNFQLAQQAINAIVSQDKHVQDVVVVIGANVSRWADLKGIEYFLEAAPQHLELDATALFKVFATAMAPEVLVEVDSEDLKACLGSAANPSRILHGHWSSQDLALRLSNQIDCEFVRHARKISVSVLGTIKTLTVSATLLNRWRDISSPDAFLIYGITRQFFTPTDDTSNSIPIVAICTA